MYDLRLQTPFTMIIASPSKSGKSTLVSKLLLRADEYFSTKSNAFYYFYNVWSPTFNDLKKEKPEIIFIKGMCDKEWLEDKCGNKSNITVILDDQAMNINKEIAEVFSVGSHQHHCNFVLLAQNLFTKNKFFRDASLNATYIILGKNPRDKSSVRFLAQQMLPGKMKELVDAYDIATKKTFTHLLLNFNQSTPDHLRMRSNIMQDNDIPMSVYIKRLKIYARNTHI